MSDTLTIAVVATTAGVVGPFIMAIVVGRINRAVKAAEAEQAHRNKLEDWAHDAELLEATKAGTAAIEVTTAKLVEVAEVTHQTHALVNSEYTASRKAELTQARATLAALRMVSALMSDAGREPSAENVEDIHVTETRIDELAKIVEAREATQQGIDDKAAADLANAIANNPAT